MIDMGEAAPGGRIIRGQHIGNSSAGGLVEPGDKLVCCDLRQASFDELNLSGAFFFGCLINGATFVHTNLTAVRFSGCFSSDQSLPTDFHDCLWDDVLVTGSSIDYVSSIYLGDFFQWPQQVADIAAGLLSSRSDVRYSSITALGDYGDPVVAPILGCFLYDDAWEVRAAALRSLTAILRRDPVAVDLDFLGHVLLSLGDEHSVVREAAIQLVVFLSPPDDLVRTALAGFTSSDSLQRLVSLRAATSLIRANSDYIRLIDRSRLAELLSAPASAIRAEAMHLLGLMDDPTAAVWAAGLSDGEASVRHSALAAISLLSNPPPVATVLALLGDPDESVRLQVLYTLGQIGGFDRSDLEGALHDSSASVRRAARQLWKSTGK